MPFRVAAFASCLSLFASLGVAQPGLVVRWETPPESGCAPREALESEVVRLLGGDPEGRRLALRAEGRIEARPDGRLSLELKLTDPDGAPVGERVLTGASCGPLGDAAALLIALAVDPAAVASATETPTPALPETVQVETAEALDPPEVDSEVGAAGAPESAGGDTPDGGTATPIEPMEESDRVAPVDEPNRETARPRAHPPIRWAFEAGAFVALGLLPGPAGGLAAGVRLARRRLRIGALLSGLFPRSETVDRGARPPADARFFGIGGRVELGGGFTAGRVGFEPLAIGEVVVVSGRSAGVSSPSRGTAAIPLLGGGARLWVRVARVQLGLDADLRFPLTRPEFLIDGLGRAHRPGAVAARVGLSLRYPARD